MFPKLLCLIFWKWGSNKNSFWNQLKTWKSPTLSAMTGSKCPRQQSNLSHQSKSPTAWGLHLASSRTQNPLCSQMWTSTRKWKELHWNVSVCTKYQFHFLSGKIRWRLLKELTEATITFPYVRSLTFGRESGLGDYIPQQTCWFI